MNSGAKAGKAPSASRVETRYLVLSRHINAHGTVFGGTILAWIDMVAAMVGERHAGRDVVTASIDSVSFHTPIFADDHVVLRAGVNYVGRTSMEVGVEVFRENPHNNTSVKATSAFVTLVALDEGHRPVEISPLLCESDQERAVFEAGRERAEIRRKNRRN
jgi:acyl-CoA hydrolase